MSNEFLEEDCQEPQVVTVIVVANSLEFNQYGAIVNLNQPNKTGTTPMVRAKPVVYQIAY